MARENPAWGSERVRGELLKLGIAASKRSVHRYRRRGPVRPPSQAWRAFLADHRPDIWAADRFTVRTLAYRSLCVLLFIPHDRRELVHWNVTAQPTAAWVWRQLLAATPWGRTPRSLLRDRDAAYGGGFVPRARRVGIDTRLGPIRAPRANAVAERVIGTLRRECLDRLVVVNERHRRAILAESVRFDNAERPHRTLRLETPVPVTRPSAGPIRSRAVLGGLQHVYERAA
jgi:transposase InsO family protein